MVSKNWFSLNTIEIIYKHYNNILKIILKVKESNQRILILNNLF